ncbi:hypothetical protein ACGFJT_37090 [Actinomadura geliboluensis]|uniref:hypothetical protein n=1 Tax=Actinomadura geliboluensis TaxID=882440 RepID=UPI0037232EC6
MNDESMMQVVHEITRRIHHLNRVQAAELNNAANHRQHGDYTRAAIAAHIAQKNAGMATIYRQLAGIVSGTWLPSPSDVIDISEGLGARVGIVWWAPPEDATPSQLHQWREFCDALHQMAMRQKYLTDYQLPAAHARQTTGQVSPRDTPEPDPLTASPAEEARFRMTAQGQQPQVPPGTGSTCTQCGEPNITLPGRMSLHQANGSASCPPARGEGAESKDEGQCDHCTAPLVLVDGVLLHAGTREPKCSPNGDLPATPTRVHQGAVPDDPEPGRTPQVPDKRTSIRWPSVKPKPALPQYKDCLGERVVLRLKNGAHARGVLSGAGEVLVLHPHEDGPNDIPVNQVAALHKLGPRAGADSGQVAGPVSEPGAYPDRPAVTAGPAQARLDGLTPQMPTDRPPQPTPSAGDATQSEVAPAPADGDHRG